MALSFFLIADLTKRQLSTKVGGTQFSFPALTAGEQVEIGLNFSQTINGTAQQVTPNIRSIRASIGRSDAPPTGGGFALSVAGHVTASIPYDATASDLQTAINAVLTGGLSVSVVHDGTSFVISFSDGGVHAVSAVHNDLDPICLVRIRTTQLADVFQTELTIVQAPIASTNTYASLVSREPYVTLIQEGGGELRPWPTIQTLTIPPTFQGTYCLSFNGNLTESLSIQDGTTQIQNAINNLFSQVGQSVTVSNPQTSVAQISFDGSAFIGYAQPLLQVQILSAPAGIPTVSLDLNTSGAFEALREADTIKGFFLEIVAEIVDDGVNALTASTWQSVTLCRVPVSIQRPINWPGLEAATQINWIQPPGPTSYIPYNASQVITGQQFYSAALGDGTSLNYTVTHNLGTENVHLTVRDNSSGAILVNGVDYHAAVSTDTVNLLFPAALSNAQVVAVISTAGPTSAFAAGLTISESQVIGLSSQLTQLTGTVSTLQSILPTSSVNTGVGVQVGSKAISFALTKVSEVIGYLGNAQPSATTGYLASALPNRPVSLAVSAAFDRELWSVPMNSSMLALGRTLSIDWGVSLQALRANCGVSYNVVVEVGNYTESGNLSVSWNTQSPVFSQPVVMTEDLITHSFGIVISRLMVNTTDTLHLDQLLYGIKTGNNAAAPTNGNFAIRCRLTGLSTETFQSDPRAWISYGLVPSLTATNGATAAQATIQ
jgi:hypothetical protein